MMYEVTLCRSEYIRVYVDATDEEQARKIAHDDNCHGTYARLWSEADVADECDAIVTGCEEKEKE